jgi:tetratricopeptide (TPR) repeat protein
MKKFSPVLLLTLAVFLVYGNTLFHSFHFDDIPSILEKPWIRGLDKIPQFIFSVFSRPLVILSFNINHAISGFNVWSYHVFNILFHLTAACLVYRLALLIETFFQSKGTPADNRRAGVPLFSAFIFALHPLSTQSVTYISSRSTIMVTIFYLAGMILFFKGWLKKNEHTARTSGEKFFFSGHWFLAGICLILGILSKQTIVTLPVMLFLFHFYFVSGATFLKWLKGQIKWMALIAVPVVCILTWKHFLGGGIVFASQTPFSWASYLLTQTFVVPFEYFRKLLFPFNLSIDVDFPLISDWSLWANWIGVLALMVYLWLCVRVSDGAKNHHRLIGFGMAWVFITLLPTSSFVPLLDMAVEHRTYLPMVGFALLAAGILRGLLNQLDAPMLSLWALKNQKVFATGAVLMLVFYSVGTIERNAVWKNEISLWTDVKKKSPNLLRPYNNLGEAYDKRGEFDKAITEFEAALSLNANYFFALNNLGNIYGKKKNYPKAIGYFEKALAQKADYSPAHYNLARALDLTGKPDLAVQSYLKAIEFNPYFEQAFFNLANLLLQRGKPKEATEYFLKFLKMQPDHARARFGLGNAYAVQGKLETAYAEFQKSATLDPEFVFPHINMANIEMQRGNIESAITTYQRLLTRHPKLAGIHKNLGMIFYQFKNNREQAAFHFKESLRLEPDQPQADVMRSFLTDPASRKKTSG